MKPTRASVCVLAAVLVVAFGCITINVYFPERDLQQAAERIVEEVRPEISTEKPEPTAEGQGVAGRSAAVWETGAQPAGENGCGSAAVWPSLSLLATAALGRVDGEFGAEKKDEIKIKIDTPRIQAIKKTLKKRYAKLLPFYLRGAVGEANTGYLVQRDSKKLSRKELRDVKILLQEEKKDRLELYKEIAAQNSIDESLVPRIGKLFSVEWQKQCKPGWWIQDRKSQWLKKKPPEKEPPKKKSEPEAA